MEENRQLQLVPRGSTPRPPGDFLRQELERVGWGQEDLARVLGRPLPTINKIIQGKKSITPETAVELAKAFGTTPDFWMAKEAAYRLSLVEMGDDSVEKRAKIYSKAPIQEMVKRRWIPTPETPEQAESIVCRFLNISSIDATPTLMANARSSIKGRGFTQDQAGWCYRAFHLSRLQKVHRYQRNLVPELRMHLRHLSGLARNVQHVPTLLAEYGVRFVVVQHLPGTRIDGAAFWVDEQQPVIALSLRYDRINYFWHTLAHELAHIFHNDADIDSDSFETTESNTSDTESRANSEASTTFIDEHEIASFIKRTSPLYTKKKIIQFANRLGVHPSIVVGQLQFRGELDWSQGTQLHSKYREILIEVAFADGWGRFLPSFK